jgi:hypothetical protein
MELVERVSPVRLGMVIERIDTLTENASKHLSKKTIVFKVIIATKFLNCSGNKVAFG